MIDANPRIVPSRPAAASDDPEVSQDVWGFRDTRFNILSDRSVSLTGSRYALSGLELPELLPWMERMLGVDVPSADTHEAVYPPPIPSPTEHPGFLKALQTILPADAITTDPLIRLRHGHGHTVDEMYAIKYGRLDRVPDLVVFPATVEEVEALVDAAQRHNVCLVPYGGGTNVTDALRDARSPSGV